MALQLIIKKLIKCVLLLPDKYFFKFLFYLGRQFIEELIFVNILKIVIETKPNSILVILQVCGGQLSYIPQLVMTDEVGLDVLIILEQMRIN